MYFDTDDGDKIYVDDEGPRDGQVLLLVHGLLCNFTFWRNNIPELAKHFRVISLDMRGHGYSLKPNVGDSQLQVSKDIHAVMVKLDLKNVILLGWSAGAHAVHHYIAGFGSDRLKGVCFVDMAPKMVCDAAWNLGIHLGPGVPVTQEVFANIRHGFEVDDFPTRQGLLPLLFAIDGAESATGEKIVQNRSVIARHVSKHCRPRYRLPPDTNEFYSRNFTLPTTSCVLSHWDALGAADFRPQIQDFPKDVAVLLIYGAKSALFPEASGQWIFDNLPSGVKKDLKVFDESGHSPHWEEPSKFNRVLARFAHSGA